MDSKCSFQEIHDQRVTYMEGAVSKDFAFLLLCFKFK